jgi:hypothetical protein
VLADVCHPFRSRQRVLDVRQQAENGGTVRAALVVLAEEAGDSPCCQGGIGEPYVRDDWALSRMIQMSAV